MQDNIILRKEDSKAVCREAYETDINRVNGQGNWIDLDGSAAGINIDHDPVSKFWNYMLLLWFIEDSNFGWGGEVKKA